MTKIDNTLFSIDENRVWVETVNNRLVFNKITSLDEVHNIEYFKQILSQYKKINIDGKKFNLVIPEIYSYDQNIMKTEFFNG